MSEIDSTEQRSAAEVGRGRSVALTSVMTALAVALGFALAPVPNVELVTLTVFSAGVALGAARGAAVGAAAMGIYSAFSPNGSGLAVPPLFAGQVVAMAVAGAAGGLTRRLWSEAVGRPAWVAALAGGGAGFLLTLLYQCAVILGLAIAMPQFNEGLVAALVANAFFSLVHLISNAVLFAVLAPVILPKLVGLGGSTKAPRARSIGPAAALTLCAVLTLVPALEAARAMDVPVPGSETPTEAVGASPDSLAALPDTARTAATVRADRPPGDIRAVRSKGLADLLSRETTLRRTGVAWDGHRASVAAGGMPASLTRVELNGRDFAGWTWGNLGVLTAAPANGEGPYLPDGPDLSLWPVFGPADSVDVHGAGPPTVVLDRWLRPVARPFGRLSMLTGGHGQRALAGEFGRTYMNGSIGLSGLFERRSGRAPVPGGSYECEGGVGALLLGMTGEWSLLLEGQRTELDRDLPALDGGPSLLTDQVLSTAELLLSGPAVGMRLFHDEGWLAVSGPGAVRRTLELDRDGIVSELDVPGPLDGVRLLAATRSASGSALSGAERTLELEADARAGFALTRNL